MSRRITLRHFLGHPPEPEGWVGLVAVVTLALVIAFVAVGFAREAGL